MTAPEPEHVLIFGAVCAAVWFAVLVMWPRVLLLVYKRALLASGFGDGPIPINTLHTQPQRLFADPLAALSASRGSVMTRGVNRDTLLTAGWLDLSAGPLVLHVPDMGDRYYSVQLTDPANNTVFAYVGTRTTGTKAGDYVITGPGGAGRAPRGANTICSPNRNVILVGRVFVESDVDLPTAHALSEQIRVEPSASPLRAV